LKKNESDGELMNLNDLLNSPCNQRVEGAILHASEKRICFINNEKLKLIESGDLAFVENKRIYVKGRSDRQVKINGKMVNLFLLENVIKLLNTFNLKLKTVTFFRRFVKD
jgi:hypothetical protein